LEKRINYSAAKTAAKDKARRDNRAAVKKAKSVTPEQRRANQTKATSDHNKRVADATAKYGKKDAPAKPKVSNTRKEFNTAFAAADKAGKKTFEFKGKKYTTKKA